MNESFILLDRNNDKPTIDRDTGQQETSTVQNHWNKRVDNTIAEIEIECIQNSKNERQKDVQRKAEFKQLVIFRFQFRVHYIDMTLKILVSLNMYISY